MDDIMVRSRYPRHSMPARRRKKGMREKGGLPETIIRQLAISILILIVAGIVKSINTPVTNYISGKIQYVLKQNIELSSIYESMDEAIGKLKGISSQKADDTKVENPASPTSAVLSATTEEQAVPVYSLIAPVKGVLSSSFGERTDPVTKVQKFHEGIDIEADKGTGILSALGGIVSEAGSSPSYGKYVKIKHENGLMTVYAHCSALNVVQGQAVKQGDVIGKVGDTGAAVGVHLHFEVWKDGQAENPLNYISVPEL